jgi:hypothetical protein
MTDSQNKRRYQQAIEPCANPWRKRKTPIDRSFALGAAEEYPVNYLGRHAKCYSNITRPKPKRTASGAEATNQNAQSKTGKVGQKDNRKHKGQASPETHKLGYQHRRYRQNTHQKAKNEYLPRIFENAHPRNQIPAETPILRRGNELDIERPKCSRDDFRPEQTTYAEGADCQKPRPLDVGMAVVERWPDSQKWLRCDNRRFVSLFAIHRTNKFHASNIEHTASGIQHRFMFPHRCWQDIQSAPA